MQRKAVSFITWCIIAVVLGVLAWRIYGIFFGAAVTSNSTGPPPVAIEVAPVTHETIREIREFTGTADPQYRYVVSSKVSGRLIKITKRIGDMVHRGEVLARIDDAEYQQAVIEAEANLKIARASLAEAQSQFLLSTQELERVKSLQQKGISSSAELDIAETSFSAQKSRLALAEAQVQQQEAALQSARIRLSYTVLIASEPGYVGERFVDEGTLLAINAPVMNIVGIDQIIIRTTIIERDYGLIKKGQQAEVAVDAYPARRFSGTVSRIAPMLQESSRVAQMEVVVVSDSLLIKPGMFSTVKVIIGEKDSAQVVPARAIIRRDGVTAVFTVSPGASTAEYHAVETGIVTTEKTEIVAPVLEGSVVTLGQHLLEDGSPVVLSDSREEERPAGNNPGKGQSR